jgi:ribosomal-protein-alanine N-acetyltransferase
MTGKQVKDISNRFHIRTYRKGDFAAVSEIWDATGLSNPARGDDEKIIEGSLQSGGTMLILEETGTRKICGTSWMTFDGRRIHLHHFGILPEWQGRGLADLLMKESMLFVKEKGYQVKLEVHETNIKAINLYKKYGFKYLGDYRVFIIRDINNIKDNH